MSGGFFDYKQYYIEDMACSIEKVITENEAEFSEDTLEEFNRGVQLLRLAGLYAQRIDWLLSGDDGEDSFHERLSEETDKLFHAD